MTVPLRRNLSVGRVISRKWSARPVFLAAGPRKPSSGHGHTPHGPTFRAGEIVRQSGIFEVIHDHAHRTAHEVVMIQGDAFPTCETCFDRVRFRLIRTAPYIFQDDDFSESKS
jgi:hypothetical protein